MARNRMFRIVLVAAALVVAGCSDDASGKHDAAPALEAGPCGSQLAFDGEFVDWDSTGAGDNFCGIFGATFTVHGTTTTDKTPPNGRVQLCLAPAATTQIDVAPPTDPSPCASMPGTYTLPGLAVANQAVIATGQPFSFRAFTSARAASFFTSFGATLDPSKAQLFVDVIGTPHAASITASSSAPQAFDGTAWAAGASGTYVVFPNVTVPAGGTDTLTIAGGATGAGVVPLVAGTITYVAVVTP